VSLLGNGVVCASMLKPKRSENKLSLLFVLLPHQIKELDIESNTSGFYDIRKDKANFAISSNRNSPIGPKLEMRQLTLYMVRLVRLFHDWSILNLQDTLCDAKTIDNRSAHDCIYPYKVH
jgi:hypothetical protein